MSIIENIKDVAKVIQKVNNINLYQQILDIQANALDLVEENSKLKKTNQELQEKLKIKEGLIYKNEAYWFRTQNDEDGPFCTHCWDTKLLTVRMKQAANTGYMTCPSCKNSYYVYPEKDTFKTGVLKVITDDFR